jgi:hypothetical protein
MSKRGEAWLKFSGEVYEHIEGYTVRQYGDAGQDLASNYTIDDCLKQVKKYISRSGKNQRPGQDALDMKKAAHYIQMAHDLIVKKGETTVQSETQPHHQEGVK